MSREDLDILLEMAVSAAQQMLSKYGEFFPFGVSIDNDGKPAMNMADIGEEQPESEAVIAFLKEAFGKNAKEGSIRATGICLDVRVCPPEQSEKTDAIQVQLEHQDGEAIDAYLPYRKNFLKRYKYGQVFACEGEACIFSANKNHAD